MKSNQFALAVLVENKFGVLTRVSGLFSRRGFNIDSLTVGVTQDPDISRITVTATGDEYIIEQFTKQLSKLQEVKKINVMPLDSTVVRELLLIKVRTDKSSRHEIIDAVNVFKGKIVDMSADCISIEITGTDTKLDAFIEYFKPYGIVEMCRTGIVALERGANNIYSDTL